MNQLYKKLKYIIIWKFLAFKHKQNKFKYHRYSKPFKEVIIRGRNNKIYINRGAKLNNIALYINGNNNKIYLGQNCRLGGDIWIEDNNSSLFIGSNTTIESAHIALTEDKNKIYIGNNCMLSTAIQIRNGDSHAIFDIQSLERINKGKPVIINNNVWIGANTIVLKGVVIAPNTIIGSGSVITKNIPQENSIWAGNPAKHIRSNTFWTRSRKS